MRQIVLDTETTGLEPESGHRIIEIGCIELENRKFTGRHYHQYVQPEREVEEQAIEVHGITNEFLVGKPIFSEVMDEFMAFVQGAELIIHNAPFDIGFLNYELAHYGDNKYQPITEYCCVVDTLVMARQKHPGQKNNLDALCKRYGVDNSQRDLHGALLDSEILADVYLLMTGGQRTLLLSDDGTADNNTQITTHTIRSINQHLDLPILRASAGELEAHQQKLSTIDKASQGQCIWLKSES
ncbi:DNA polymerase III subunit epsilon [Candidatus Endobugula sertula]|uniref:DNA polymerase III subunit epsilon n=1 Tax=Candidatus Endobugula sertula TaxID=62101 RepID=A0A1D2QQP5_9GAMM|nr:DNA polymerase III subunit epsilon [Candidatus Endobugula sertula]